MDTAQELSIFKWQALSAFETSSPLYLRGKKLLETVNWDTLRARASGIRNGQSCNIEGPYAIGGRNLVRILTFEDGVRWVARLRLPTATSEMETVSPKGDEASDALVDREIACLRIVSERTAVPVPKVYGHIATGKAGIGAATIFMECLTGNVAMDICFDTIPTPFKSKFFQQMAYAQTQISTILLPRIGSVIRRSDGQYDIGPLPGIGGPFDMASDFLRAWAATAKYPHSMEYVKQSCGDQGDEIARSTAEFTERLRKLANRICMSRDHGPFPLVHVDYGHNNIIVTPEYDIMGVIDWEHAYAAPWQVVDYPLTLHLTPKPMDAPWNYDDSGAPTDEDLRLKYVERTEYLECVRAAEKDSGGPATLSSILADVNTQNVATAMRLFTNGKMGYYSRVLAAYD
ncbi:MAG: hypothetical protein Q9162_004813 [Coniocarpon cinnabarinum]